MNANTNTEKGVKPNFEAGYRMLPAGIQIDVRDGIMEECGWSAVATFHNKRKGIRRTSPLEVRVIEAHFSKYGINPWTGEKLAS